MFQNNVTSGNFGGGLYSYGAIITATQFISNYAKGGGGAQIFHQAAISGALFARNVMSDSLAGCGGGLLTQGDLTLTNSRFTGNFALLGGGGLCSRSAATIQDTVFEDNTAGEQGGGAYVFGPNAQEISTSRFTGNSANRGGGLALYMSGPAATVVNSLFAGNAATSGHGSGALIENGGATLVHTTFAGQSTNAGAAIESLGTPLGVTNTIIASYTVGISATAGSATEDYNLFFGNGTNRVGLAAGAHSLAGNPYFANPAGGDYRLQPASAAINAGVNAGVAVDFEGDARPAGGGFDIGYDEAANLRRVYMPAVLR